MALCSNSTSLFELAFGVNAVYAALSTRLADTRTQLADVALKNFQLVDPHFVVPLNERAILEDWISRAFSGYQLAYRLRLIPQLLSLALCAIAIFALLQTARLGDKCEVKDTQLIWFSAVALLIAPVLYHLYNALLAYLVAAVTARTFQDKGKTNASLQLYRLCVDARHTINQSKEIMESYERLQGQNAVRELRELLSKFAHPIRTWRKYWQRRARR